MNSQLPFCKSIKMKVDLVVMWWVQGYDDVIAIIALRLQSYNTSITKLPGFLPC